jgi:hypothetical protein
MAGNIIVSSVAPITYSSLYSCFGMLGAPLNGQLGSCSGSNGHIIHSQNCSYSCQSGYSLIGTPYQCYNGTYIDGYQFCQGNHTHIDIFLSLYIYMYIHTT